jgi:hypothetical protein
MNVSNLSLACFHREHSKRVFSASTTVFAEPSDGSSFIFCVQKDGAERFLLFGMLIYQPRSLTHQRTYKTPL